MEEARQAPPKAVRRQIAPPAFGDLLRRFRTAIGWTQEQLAERASVSARAVVNYETGVTLRPQRQTVYLLADALGLAPGAGGSVGRVGGNVFVGSGGIFGFEAGAGASAAVPEALRASVYAQITYTVVLAAPPISPLFDPDRYPLFP